MARLENAFRSFANDIRTKIAEIKENVNETRSIANRKLNEFEHPELSLQRNRRNPSHEVRPSPPPRHMSMPLPPYQPPYILEHRTPPPPPEYVYPPPGYNPYSPKPWSFPLEHRPRPHEFRQPFEERAYQRHRERYFPPCPHRDQGHRDYNPEE